VTKYNKYKNYYGSPKFYKILENLAKLHSEKNKQYASKSNPLGNFIRCSKLCDKLLNPKIENKPLAYLLILMSKQIDSVFDIIGENKENTIESLQDKLSDIAVYSILGIILSEEDKKEGKRI